MILGRRPTVRARWLLLLGAVAVSTTGLLLSQRAPGDPSLLAVVRKGALDARLVTTGTLRPLQALTYRSPVVGREVEIVELVPEGQLVDEGDLLVRLDTTEVRFEAERAREEHRQAELDLDVAGAELDEARAAEQSATEGEGALNAAEVRTRLQLADRRVERLREEYLQLAPLLTKGYITRDELSRSASALEQAEEEAALARQRALVMERLTRPRELSRASLLRTQKEVQLDRARARAAEAAARLAALRRLVDECAIHARRAGLVVYEEYLSASPRRKIRIGDRVTSSQGLVSIPEVSRMVLDASVSESQVSRVRPGQPADITVEALGGVKLTGRVARVGTLASSSVLRPLDDKRFDLVIDIDPTSADLRPEMTARADITVARVADSLLVPVTAVVEGQGGFAVQVLAGGRVESRPVTLGESNETVVEILEGVREGEQVLLADPDPGARAGRRPMPAEVSHAGRPR